MLLKFLMNLNLLKVFLWTNRHICTSTCIDYHKLCEIHYVFQREYITKRHIITNSMHIGHTRYTSTLLNIKSQYAHDFSSLPRKTFVVFFRQW